VSDYTLDSHLTTIVGVSGSGKSTAAFRYLLNCPAACRFIWDDQGQASARLKIPHASTASELDRALSTRWVLFNPHRMFPGQAEKGFAFFCEWAFAMSQSGRGKKLFMADEIWRYQDRDKIPMGLAKIAQMGRAENLELVSVTQRPHLISDSIMGETTELICFLLTDSVRLRKVQSMGAGEALTSEIGRLPKGAFVSFNPQNMGQLGRGRIF
jgi:hypothetical protein